MMSNPNAFLDSSIIYFRKSNDAKYQEFKNLISSDRILIINDLVRLEVLQGINYKDENLYKKFVKLFDSRFEVKEINREIYKMAREVDRKLKAEGVTLKKGKTKDIAGVIDIVNFCTAKYYECEIFHNDNDFEKIEGVW
jgi:predicted nucleic acid-binding protein